MVAIAESWLDFFATPNYSCAGNPDRHCRWHAARVTAGRAKRSATWWWRTANTRPGADRIVRSWFNMEQSAHICNHGNDTGPSCSGAVGPGTGIQVLVGVEYTAAVMQAQQIYYRQQHKCYAICRTCRSICSSFPVWVARSIFDRSHKHNDKLVCTAVLAAKCSRGGRPSAGDALCLFV